MFGIHFVFGQVFHIDFAETSQADMQSDVSSIHTFNFHTLHQFAAEVQIGRRSHHCAFVAGKNGLEIFGIFFANRTIDILRNRRFTQSEQSFFERIVVAIVKEAKGTSARSGVVDNFGNHRIVFAEIQFVTDTDFTGRIYQNIPQTKFFVEFAQKEHFDLGTGFFLVSVQTSGKYLGIVEDKHVAFIKIFQDILESSVFDFTRIFVQNHQFGFIAIHGRMLRNTFFGQMEFKFRQFHKSVV